MRVESFQSYVPWLGPSDQKQTTSQFGEDGLIEATFNHIGTTVRRCFEVGAGNGVHLSNTHALREQGWKALLIENFHRHFKFLDGFANESVTVSHETLTPENVNELIAGQFDFGSLDVDGPEYEIWEAMETRPRVMLVEFSPYSINERDDQNNQATLKPMLQLGQKKQYTVVAKTYCNLLFVANEAL